MTRLLQRPVQHEEAEPVIRLAHVTVRYNSEHVALDDVSFTLQRGERVAVVGPNGAGKSTLFKVIAGILRPTSGSADVYGHAPGGHICIAYVPQRNLVDWSFPVTVADVVMMGRVGKLGLLRWPRRRDWEIVHESLRLVGMEDMADRQIGELSGGQQQRVFIARALAQEAEVLLMDEPFTGLDMPSQEVLFGILDRLRDREVTVMVSTHDLNQAADRFDRIILLNRRLIAMGRAEEVLTEANLLAAYGGQMAMLDTEKGTLVVSDTCCSRGMDDV
ncbi:MAG: metal ABC transporter ATP-binding protein [Anaerolineae bacterium]|nr:metal ABC transporter ATP-binding protein [Anaerolineae bacterium]